MNAAHLERVLRSYACHYNCRRPHQGLSQEIPAMERAVPLTVGPPLMSGAGISNVTQV